MRKEFKHFTTKKTKHKRRQKCRKWGPKARKHIENK